MKFYDAHSHRLVAQSGGFLIGLGLKRRHNYCIHYIVCRASPLQDISGFFDPHNEWT